MKTQWWLAELDRHGNAKLCDGAHQRREGAEKAATILRRLGLAENRNFAVAEVRLTELTGNHDPVNDEAIDTLNAIGLRPNTGDKPRRMRRLDWMVMRLWPQNERERN